MRRNRGCGVERQSSATRRLRSVPAERLVRAWHLLKLDHNWFPMITKADRNSKHTFGVDSFFCSKQIKFCKICLIGEQFLYVILVWQ